jgi:predicted GTPase
MAELRKNLTRSWFELVASQGGALARTWLSPMLRRWSSGKPAEPTSSLVENFEQLREMRQEFEQTTVRLGIIGESGSGKSSLINAIVGRAVAPVGALIETTQTAQEVPVDGLTLVDLPGCGTPTWPKDTYIERLQLLDGYDGFILVTAHRLKECDALLFRELSQKAGKPCFVVRSHFDLAVAHHAETEARSVIAEHIRRQLQAGPDLPVYMVCSTGAPHYDLEKLILAIRQTLPEWKQVRFILAAQAYGRQTLAEKRQAAKKIVGVYAGLAAANALNPIPGLDIGVDVGLLTTMSRQVISAYGLRPEQIESLQGQANVRSVVYKGLREVAERFTPYLTEKFVIAALRRLGMKVTIRNTAKWVPLVGTAVSAGIGYHLAQRFGQGLIDDCESAAEEIMAVLDAGRSSQGSSQPL